MNFSEVAEITCFLPQVFSPFDVLEQPVKVSDVSQGEQWLEMKLQVLCSPH